MRLPLSLAVLLLAAPARADGPKSQSAPTVDVPSGGPSVSGPAGPALGDTQLNTLNVQGGGVAPGEVAAPPGAAAVGVEESAANPPGGPQLGESLQGAADPGVRQGGMSPRSAARSAGDLRREVSPAAQAPGGAEGALNSHYDHVDAGLGALNADGGMGAVKGLEPTLAKQVAHEVQQGNTEASRYGAQAPAAARAALAFYQTAVNLVAEQFKAHRVTGEQLKAETGQVVEQAREHFVTRELPDGTGAAHEVGALQSLAAGVVPGDPASLRAFEASAKAAAKFMSVDLPNLADVEKVLSSRPKNGLAPVIRFYRRGAHEIAADLTGLTVPGASGARQLVVVPSDLKAQMKLGEAGPDVPAASEGSGSGGFVARWLMNARLRHRAGAAMPAAAAQSAWAAVRAEARELWDGGVALVRDRLFGLIRPARLGGLVSSDRALLRLGAIYRGRVDGLDSADAPVLAMDLSTLTSGDLTAAAMTHEALTGEGSAGWFAGQPMSAASRADFRAEIDARAFDRIDRELIEAMPARALAYADLKSGVAVLLVRGVTPAESAALGGLLRDFEPRVENGVWIGQAAGAGAREALAEGLRLITGRETEPALAEDVVRRAFDAARPGSDARAAARLPGRRFQGYYRRNGARWLVELVRSGARATLLFSNPTTHSVRLAAALP